MNGIFTSGVASFGIVIYAVVPAIKIKTNIPTEFLAKKTTRYYPKPGSSAGRIITKQTGARRVQKDFEKLMKTLFSLGDSFNKGKRAKMPKVNISRYISKE